MVFHYKCNIQIYLVIVIEMLIQMVSQLMYPSTPVQQNNLYQAQQLNRYNVTLRQNGGHSGHAVVADILS